MRNVLCVLPSRALLLLVLGGACFFANASLRGQTGDDAARQSTQAADDVQSNTEANVKDIFDSPIRIKAGDEVVSVESPGFACPTIADVDNDGKVDLVVGQFNNGNMLFCRNVAETGEAPRFAASQWLSSGESRAEVPGVW